MTEWDQRQLCPDGACVGVIGPDGTCKVCGRAAPNWGDERKRGLIADAIDEDDDEDEDDDDDDVEDSEDGEDEDQDDEEVEDQGPPSPDWAERKLCSDDACIGVIGDKGVCKVCGKSAA